MKSPVMVWLIGASWKTTLSGYGVAALVAAHDFIISMQPGGSVDWLQLLLAVGLALWGRFSKDHNMSNAPTPLPVPEVVTPAPPKS